MVMDRVGIYTQALNAAFVQGYNAVPKTSPIDQGLQIIPSHGRVENYPWMYPPPLAHQWNGFRQFALLGDTNYRVPNITYTAEFLCLLEDLEDDQIAGFKLQAAALAKGMNEWLKIQSMINLAAGQTTLCFDGTNFFASSHTIGTGNNIVTGTAGSSDNVSHAMAVLITENNLVKPMLWQNRQPPNFKTDAGSLQADETRKVRWWSDLRGAAAFGFWWDAILVKWTNTPVVTDMQTTLAAVNAAFRTFTYPKNLPSDVNLYPHGQTSFTDKSVLIICSSKIEHIVRQALTLSLVSQTENYFKGWASLACSGYLDAVV